MLLAPDCSSWGMPARYTSMRSYINAGGSLDRDFVQRGNCMVSRSFVKTLFPSSDTIGFTHQAHGFLFLA